MQEGKLSLIKILLIINLVVSTCAAVGVGYVAYEQTKTPSMSHMEPRGDNADFPGNGPNEIQQNESEEN